MCLKKEKSRNAARHRRGKENEEFYSLAKLIPIAEGTSSQLDKASIIRLTMSDLHLHNCFLGKFVFSGAQQDFYQSRLSGDFGKIELNSRTPQPSCTKKEIKTKAPEEISGLMAVQSVDGFVFIIDEHGIFIYVSEAVSQYLGMSPHDLMGYPINNFIHEEDAYEFRSKFLIKSAVVSSKSSRNETAADNTDEALCCTVRMKCPLNKRGTMAKCHGYQVMFLSGHRVKQSYKRLPPINRSTTSTSTATTTSVRPTTSSNDDEDIDENETSHVMYFGFAQTLPQVMLSFDNIDDQSFVIRLDHSFRISYCEEQLTYLLGYKLKEVIGKTLYQFIHPNDLHRLRDCHQETLQKTQSRLQSYRWLLNGGDKCAWLESSFAAIIDKNNSNGDEQSFVCHSQFIRTEMTRVETATVDRVARKKSPYTTNNRNSSSLKRRHSEMMAASFSEVNSPFATSSENTTTDNQNHSDISDDAASETDFNCIDSKPPVASLYNGTGGEPPMQNSTATTAAVKRKSSVLTEGKTDEEKHQQPAAKQRKSPDEDASSSSSSHQSSTSVGGAVVKHRRVTRSNSYCKSPDKPTITTTIIKTEVNHPDDCIIVTVPSSPSDEDRGENPMRGTTTSTVASTTTLLTAVSQAISSPVEYANNNRQETTCDSVDVITSTSSSPHMSAQVDLSSPKKSDCSTTTESLPLNLSTTPTSSSSGRHHRRSNSSDGSTCSGGYKSRHHQVRSFSSSNATDHQHESESIIKWTNPPNQQIPLGETSPLVANSSAPLLLIHHYPFGGIAPSLLDSNPRLAKMIAAPGGGYPGHMCVAGVAPSRRLSQHNGAAAAFQIVTSSVLSPIPHTTSPPADTASSSSSPTSSSSTTSLHSHPLPPCSLAAIVDELRKNPMRKVNPPNKVLVPPNSQLQYQALLKEQERQRRLGIFPSVQR